MSDLVGEWCNYHHNLNDIGQGRRVAQLRVLREFERTLPGAVEQVRADDLERYMAQMIRDGYHPHTVVFNVSLIRPFLKWLWQHDLIDVDRWLRLKAVERPRGAWDGQPRPYTRVQLRQFWRELDERYPWTRDKNPQLRTPARGEYWVRRWAAGHSAYKRVYPYARRLQIEAIISLALYGGLRRNEIYKMPIEQMHYLSEYIRVASRKGPRGEEKVRIVPMNEAIALGVGNWIEFREQVLAPDHDFPWLCLFNGRGAINCTVTQPMSHPLFSGLLREIGSGWEFHRLRHTFATERYRAGTPLEILQHLLGHATIRQTQGYAQIEEDRIIAASRASDREFLKAVQNGRRNTNQEGQ